MFSSPIARGAPLPSWARVALAVTGLTIAAAVVLDSRADTAEHARLLAEAQALGIERLAPDLARLAAREADPETAGALLARGLMLAELDRHRLRGLGPTELAAELAAGRERLAFVEARGRALLASRPAQVDGPLLAGGAALARDLAAGRLDRDLAWEPALRAAVRLAPNDPQPLRLLAWAYLEAWSVLPSRVRRDVPAVLTAAFADDETRERLLDRWLRIHGHDRVALAVLPQSASAWRGASVLLARRGDWEGARLTTERARELARREASARLVGGRARLARGDRAGARRELLAVVRETPRDRAGAALVAAALEAAPAGAPDPGLEATVLEWLDWNAELALVAQPALPAAAVARLGAALPEIAVALRAEAALQAGDLPAAELLARRAGPLDGEPWARFHLLYARELLARGERDAAGVALALVVPQRQRTAVWRRLAEDLAAELARAGGDPDGEPPPVPVAPLPSAGSSRRGRGATPAAAPGLAATDWQYRGGAALLDLSLPAGAAGLRIAPLEVPAAGCLVELDVDGETRLVAVAAGTAPSLNWPTRLAPGLHRLRVDTLAGERYLPGAVGVLQAVDHRALEARGAPPP